MIMNDMLMENTTYRSVLKVDHSGLKPSNIAGIIKQNIPELEQSLVAEQQTAPAAFHWNRLEKSSIHSIDAVISHINKLAKHFSPLDYEVFMGRKPGQEYQRAYAIIATYQGLPIAGMEVSLP
jgi:hypothetical protein